MLVDWFQQRIHFDKEITLKSDHKKESFITLPASPVSAINHGGRARTSPFPSPPIYSLRSDSPGSGQVCPVLHPHPSPPTRKEHKSLRLVLDYLVSPGGALVKRSPEEKLDDRGEVGQEKGSRGLGTGRQKQGLKREGARWVSAR